MQPDRPLQQISVQDISSFVVVALENRESFLSKRIDIASKKLTGKRVAEILSAASGHPINYAQVPITEAYAMNAYAAKMYERFDEAGDIADIDALRRDYPKADWHTFEEWARVQDWSFLNAKNPT